MQKSVKRQLEDKYEQSLVALRLAFGSERVGGLVFRLACMCTCFVNVALLCVFSLDLSRSCRWYRFCT